MKALKLIFIFLFLFYPVSPLFADTAEVENYVQNSAPESAAVTKEPPSDRFYAQSYYEYSHVNQGYRKGLWKVFSERIAWLHKDLPCPYIDVTVHERLGETDYAYESGAYFKIEQGYFHGAVGFSSDRDFLYTWRILAEIEKNLIPDLNWHVYTRFSHYGSGDVLLLSPGLIYYFEDNYLMLHYGISFTENRGDAQFVSAKLSLSVTENSSFFAGAALGRRLYDIFLLDASEQDGYILFTGIETRCNDDISLMFGYSYGEEDPAFIKRSLSAQVKVKF